jgi:hypothetical protein
VINNQAIGILDEPLAWHWLTDLSEKASEEKKDEDV